MVERHSHSDPGPPTFVRACVHLRTKTQYYRPEDQEQPAGMIADSPRLSYFCHLTQDYIGPDQKACSPDSCQAPRPCHEGPASPA